MFQLDKVKSKWWIEILSLALISALIYMVNINQFSYLRDDWYYAYDGYIAGPSIFKIMFTSDRPARGLFFGIYYFLFGPQPLPYHIGAYVWRLLGAFSALWLFHLLWPRQRVANFSMALLFLIYPGFLSWPSGIDYQPHLASLCLHTFSIALTLGAIKSTNKVTQIFLLAGSILTGLTAIALVDYAIGMEAFRIFCIFLVIVVFQHNPSYSRKVILAIRSSLIPLTIPLFFIVWKIFIFKGDRKATDISYQLSNLIHAPMETISLWRERLYTSSLNVSFLAWWTPLKQHYSYLQQNDILPVFLIAILAITLFLLTIRFITDPNPNTKNQTDFKSGNNFPSTAIWLGLAGLVFGLLPVIMANRFVIFTAYSHYALPTSLAAIILVVGLIHLLTSGKIQLTLISLLIGISALTHHALAIQVIKEQETIRNFWWQVYWRIPKIEENTTLAVYYPDIYYGEDTDIVWGPANFLYYPQVQPGVERVKYKLAGTKLDKAGIQNIIEETAKISVPYRSHFMFINYHKVLVISQPSNNSCVHVIDERWPELSKYDTPQTALMFPHSKIKTALVVNEENSPPLNFVFGIEPAHTWCFYYQEAELARQQGDWETVAALGTETTNLGLAPTDDVEWTPFIQAYAYLGQTEKVEQLATFFKNDSFYKLQFCKNLKSMEDNGYPLQPDMQSKVNTLFCK